MIAMNANAIYSIIENDYISRMMHPIPDTTVVEREKWIADRVKGKRVLDIGASGYLGELVKKVAHQTSVDRTNANYCIDVEKDNLPDGEYDYILCGEIIEHLSNPGIFLDKLKKYKCPIIISVPNAFGNNRGRIGIENVNKEHVAWYSYHTLLTLIERHGYRLFEWYWYKGKPYTAEGIIFVIGRAD